MSQPELDLGEYPIPPGQRAWIRPCGAPDPFCISRPTPANPFRLQVLTCTRPENHGGPFHDHATFEWGVLARWGRDGTPHYPPPVKVRSTDGPADSV
jgi:hypothetical protein